MSAEEFIPNVTHLTASKTLVAAGGASNGELVSRQTKRTAFVLTLILIGVFKLILGFPILLTLLLALPLGILLPILLVSRKRDGRIVLVAVIDRLKGRRVSKHFCVGLSPVVEEPKFVTVLGADLLVTPRR
jgi:hypothetical protein